MQAHRLLLNLLFLPPLRPSLRWLARAGALRRSRRALAALDPEQLADVGLSTEAQRREAARPVWDAPAHWFDRRGPF